MSANVKRADGVQESVETLGSRLKAARLASGISLRELARRMTVSPSFISQLENGKSQPSVATLYSLSRLLNISIDGLFAESAAKISDSAHQTLPVLEVADAAVPREPQFDGVSRNDLGAPPDAWFGGDAGGRLSILTPENRSRLLMDSGVAWEQLARVDDPQIDFMEIVYPPGSSSTSDGRMLQHAGYEFGYLLQGELQVTYGFDTYVLRAGQSIGMNSWVPHLFINTGDVEARGVWCVHHHSSTTESAQQ